MARKQRQPIPEDGPPGAPAWMLTFCDCMTLLLTFFVLLLSFSSFEPSTQQKLHGAMKFISAPSITDNPDRVDDSLVDEVPPDEDLTDKGAEKKRSDDQNLVKNPKSIKPLNVSGYHEEAVLVMGLDKMFIGRTNILTDWGKARLNTIASYLKLVPRYVIIGQSVPRSDPSISSDSNVGLQRSWCVLEFLKAAGGLHPEQCLISDQCPRKRYENENRATMQIVLLARDATRPPGGG